MAEVRAFRGLRYAPEVVQALGDVTCPPYDVMDPAGQRAFHERSPYNAVRLELGYQRKGDTEAENRYRRAAATLAEWRASGVLREEPSPCLYRYAQTYRDTEGTERTRVGMFVLLRLEEFETGIVLPHEETFPHHKEDRFRLLSACRAQISPIFGLFRSPDPSLHARLREASASVPLDFEDEEGVRHQLGLIYEPALHQAYADDLRACQVFIADGHHRYETALQYRAARRAQEPGAAPTWYDFVMILLVEMSDPGLAVFPTHRVVRVGPVDAEDLRKRLARLFTVTSLALPHAAESATATLQAQLSRHTLALVLHPGHEALLLTNADEAAMRRASEGRSAAWQDLDIARLHRLVLPELRALMGAAELRYTRDTREAVRAAREEAAIACLVPAPTVDDLRAVSLSGERMPEKSTYFYPKARTGLVFHAEETDADL